MDHILKFNVTAIQVAKKSLVVLSAPSPFFAKLPSSSTPVFGLTAYKIREYASTPYIGMTQSSH